MSYGPIDPINGIISSFFPETTTDFKVLLGRHFEDCKKLAKVLQVDYAALESRLKEAEDAIDEMMSSDFNDSKWAGENYRRKYPKEPT